MESDQGNVSVWLFPTAKERECRWIGGTGKRRPNAAEAFHY